MENLILSQICELLAKTLEIAESVLVDDACEAEQFEQRILQRRRREEKFMAFLQRQLECIGDHVGWLINVSQTMRFVNDHEVPRRVATSEALFRAN